MGRQADNGQGRNHRGVEEGRQTHRGEREKKNGRAAGKRPENAGIKNRGAKTQASKRIENCALPFSGENRGNRSRRLAPRQRRRAGERGKKTSRQTHADSTPKRRAPVTPAQEPRERDRRSGAQHSPPWAQQRQKPRAAAPRRRSMDRCTTFGRPRARTLPEGTYLSTSGCRVWAILRTTNSRFEDSF